jgi:hypothetical protein
MTVELDRTEIVIQQRSGLELLDLSLLLLRRHFFPLLAASALFTLPLMLLNVWLVHWMVSEDAILVAESTLQPELVAGARYTGHLIALFFVQFPLASLPTTMLLGSLVFYQSMGIRSLLGQILQLWKLAVLILGLARLGIVPLLLEPLVDRSLAFDSSVEWWILLLIPAVVGLVRAISPFAPEIIGLERCPLRRSKKAQVTYRARSRFLHGPLQGSLMARFIAALIHCGLLLAMLVGVSLFVQAILVGSWEWTAAIYYVVLPLSLWMIGLLMTVFRYLSYIDSRIRLEGWEIDLRLRAEARRLDEHRYPATAAAESAGNLPAKSEVTS